MGVYTIPAARQEMPQPTPAGSEDSGRGFSFPAVRTKKVAAAFDGGRLTSDGERCFLPSHVDDTASGRPVAMLLRTGKPPTCKEVSGHIRRLVRQSRRHWPDTHLTIRGDGHYGRPEVMLWCEGNVAMISLA
jgi:hypothetical protein